MNSYLAVLLFCPLLCVGGLSVYAGGSEPLLVKYDGQIDKLINGTLIHEKNGGGEGCIPVTRLNPAGHTTVTYSGDFDNKPKIPHGNHVDVIVKGRLLHKHGRHYDDHGPIDIITPANIPKKPATNQKMAKHESISPAEKRQGKRIGTSTRIAPHSWTDRVQNVNYTPPPPVETSYPCGYYNQCTGQNEYFYGW